MKYVLNTSETREVEQYTIKDIGVPSLVLMERAALFVCNKVLELEPKSVVCLCGTGNNGADGLAVCRMLIQNGIKSKAVIIGSLDKCSEECKTQTRILTNMGYKPVNICEGFDKELISGCDLIVDAIFGIGISRDVEDIYKDVIDSVNDKFDDCKIVAVDISSGLSSDNGSVMGCAVKADYTCTFGYYKVGHFLMEGLQYCGDISLIDIGIVSNDKSSYSAKIIENDDVHKLLPSRDVSGNKGTFGKVLIIAGSDNMPGAALLSAKASLKAGTGMVKVITTKNAKDSILKAMPEIMVSEYEAFDKDLLDEGFKFADVCVMGPGLGTSDTAARILTYTMRNYKGPLIVDADGINLLAGNMELLLGRKDTGLVTVLTPHPGEFKRLFKTSAKEYQNIEYCKRLASEYGIVLVSKDARSIITDGIDAYINISGNDALATAGSGDVLTGILSYMICNGTNYLDMVSIGCYLHGSAGTVASKELTTYSVTASNIIDYYSKVLMNYVR